MLYVCLSFKSHLVCSYLCLYGQLVGDLQLSQLQRQLKPVFWVCGHSQRLLLETLKRQRHKTHQHATSPKCTSLLE